MKYSEGLRVCDEDNVRGVMREDELGDFFVEWSDGHSDPMADGWRTEYGEKVWPLRPLTEREELALETLESHYEPMTTAYVERSAGKRGLSSALSRLRIAGEVLHDRKTGKWRPNMNRPSGGAKVRQSVKHGDVPAMVDRLVLDDPRADEAPVTAEEGASPAHHVDINGERMLLVPVDADVARLTAERDEARQWADRRGKLLDIVVAALGGSWEEAVGKVESLRAERDAMATVLDEVVGALGSDNGMALVWGKAGERAKRVMRDLADLRSMLGERSALLHGVAVALGCTWEEAPEKAEALVEEREEFLDDIKIRDAELSEARQRAHGSADPNHGATLRRVALLLGVDGAQDDAEAAVERLLHERAALRRDLEAGEAVERALTDALAKSAGDLARERAAQVARTARAVIAQRRG